MASINTSTAFYGSASIVDVRIEFGMAGLRKAFDNEGLIALAKAEAGLYLPASAVLEVVDIEDQSDEEETVIFVHMTRID